MTRRVHSPVLALGLALGIVGSAEACRLNLAPKDRIAHAYDAIVLAKIESARYADGQGDMQRPWRAVARSTGAVEGQVAETRFEIGRTGESAACDDGQLIAETGQTWVLYLRKQANGDYAAVQSYPLSVARGIDPRLTPK